MEPREAMVQIAEIRSHLAKTETFRGYRSLMVGLTGVLAFAAAAVQTAWIPNPSEHPMAWLFLWLGVAALSVSAIAVEMAVRCWKSKSAWTVRLTRLAVGQFIPCLLAGAAVTAVLGLSAHDSLWMLPGLWSIVFSLGVFASAPLLPRAIGLAAAYYLTAGVVCLLTGRDDAALSPWTMAGTFGVGQLLVALVLFSQLERSDETSRRF